MLGGRFQFDNQTKQLRLVWVSGPFIEDRVDKVRKGVDEHPEWPDARAVEALKAAGAKFGPDDRAELLRALPLKKLEPFTGSLEAVSAEFVVRLTYQDEKPEAPLQWRVEAKWHSEDGQYEADCSLSLEPFEGFLVSFRLKSPPRRVRR